MTWVKLSDTFPTHPKAIAAGDAACWLYVAALCWAKHHLTDGHIPRAVVPTLVRCSERQALALAGRLVLARLWEEEGDDYRIHNYAERNWTRAEVEAERSGARARMRAARSANVRPNNGTVRSNNEDCSPELRGSSSRVRVGARAGGSETETETETETGKRESTHTPLEASLVRIFPDLADDVSGLLSELQDTFPGLDYVQLAKEGALWKRANKARHSGASLLRKWCSDAWQKRQALKARVEETVAQVGAARPDYHAPARLKSRAELDSMAAESLRLEAEAEAQRKREIG